MQKTQQHNNSNKNSNNNTTIDYNKSTTATILNCNSKLNYLNGPPIDCAITKRERYLSYNINIVSYIERFNNFLHFFIHFVKW